MINRTARHIILFSVVATLAYVGLLIWAGQDQESRAIQGCASYDESACEWIRENMLVDNGTS